ncbi:MAG: hypothetical protein IPK68_22645 [Bdellovibrionales bacterium]|nr:hypothetical protein [Bdellovibrionales bacterium]
MRAQAKKMGTYTYYYNILHDILFNRPISELNDSYKGKKELNGTNLNGGKFLCLFAAKGKTLFVVPSHWAHRYRCGKRTVGDSLERLTPRD